MFLALLVLLIWHKAHAQYDMHTSTSCVCSSWNHLRGMRFLQQFCWWFSSSGMWCHVGSLMFVLRFRGECHFHLQGSRVLIRILIVGCSWRFFFDVLLTVHLSTFILVINQLDAQNLLNNKFVSCLYMFRALLCEHYCAHHQEVKIVLHSTWYHHTCRWLSRAQSSLNLCTRWPPTECEDTRCRII